MLPFEKGKLPVIIRFLRSYRLGRRMKRTKTKATGKDNRSKANQAVNAALESLSLTLTEKLPGA